MIFTNWYSQNFCQRTGILSVSAQLLLGYSLSAPPVGRFVIVPFILICNLGILAVRV